LQQQSLHGRFETMNTTYRWADHADYVGLGEIMFDAVRNGPSQYNEAQRAAWVPGPRQGADWDERLSKQSIATASVDGTLVGFMSLAPEGYVDFAYIRPPYQGSGIFRALFDMIGDLAVSQGQKRLWTHASLMAQPAFTAMGFEILQNETVAINDQLFERFEMQKLLSL
jgi:putative acetyltransferase